MSAEEWRVITDWPRYEVSNMGNVRVSATGRAVKQARTPDGYFNLTLCHLTADRGPGRTKKFKVHRLVAMAFLENPENKPQVNHIDGCKTNNCLANLEWATGLENMRHASRTGLLPNQSGANNHAAKLTEERVMAIFQMRKAGKTLKEIGQSVGVSLGNVHLVLKGKSWRHVGQHATAA